MRRLAAVLVAALLLAGCAPLQRHYDGAARPPDQTALITTKKAEPTQKLLENAFGSTPHLRGATLHTIDSKEGTTAYRGEYKIYNFDWDWGLKVEVLPGEHTLVVMPNHYMTATLPQVTISFTAKAGHQYYLGQIMEVEGLRYQWTPVLVDQTDNVLVYPAPVEWRPSGK